MGKVDPHAIKIGRRETMPPVTFLDPDNPDLPIKFKPRKLGPLDINYVTDKAGQRYAEYVTGFGVKGKPGYTAPKMLDPVDGQYITMSHATCFLGSLLEHGQAPGPPSERYTFEELVSFMVSDAILHQMEELAELIPDIPEEKQPEGDEQDSPLTGSGPQA